MWKKLVEANDIISLESTTKEYRVIIEARKEESLWCIIKKYISTSSSQDFVEEYYAKSNTEAKSVIASLKNERMLKRKDIDVINKFKQKVLRVEVRRCYKEKHVEKWEFSLNDNFSNTVIIHFGRVVELDIMMHEKYKYIEEKIIMKLLDILGMHDCDCDIEQHVYYYSKRSNLFMEADAEDIAVDMETGY